MTLSNLFLDAATPGGDERFDVLLSHRNLVVERIVSPATDTARAYVQTQDEWVVLLRGEAVLTVSGKLVALGAGDHVFLPAGTPHTVEHTTDGAMWLAVHLHPSG